MAPARLELLGGFRLTSGQRQVVDVGAKKNRALLAILAMAPGHGATRDRLAGLLWSDRGEEQAKSSLRQALASLHKDFAALGDDPLVLNGDRVALDPMRVSIDVVDFLAASASSDPTEFGQAANLYKGALLDGLNVSDEAFDEWLREARAELSARAIEMFHDLCVALEGAERVGMAERLVALDPLREASHLTLMRAHTDQGQAALAIKHYEACKLLLKRELGIEPGAELQQLRRRLGDLAVQPSVPQTKTRIAILPFDNLSGDKQQDHFIDGIVEDLITELSRYRHLSIRSLHSALEYKDRQVSAQEAGCQLGVDFVVRGSVRMAGGHLRINVQLIDTETDEHAWAERFDREMQEVFAVQDEVVASILATLTFNLDQAVEAQRRRSPTTSVTAYTHFLQARAAWRGGDEVLARKELLEALRIDPAYARAHAYLAFLYGYSLFSFTADMAQPAVHSLTRDHLRRALAIDSNDPFVLHRAAMAYALLGETEMALRYAEQSAVIGPRDIEALVVHGTVLTFAGEHEAGLALIEQASRVEPRLPPGFRVALSDNRYLARDYVGSLLALESIVNPPAYVKFLRAPCLAQLGQLDLARDAVVAALQNAPMSFDPVMLARNCASLCASPKDAEHWLEGFRKAGIAV